MESFLTWRIAVSQFEIWNHKLLPSFFILLTNFYLFKRCIVPTSYIKLKFSVFSSRSEVFHLGRDKSNLAEIYSSYISQTLAQYPESKGIVGALILEPGKTFFLNIFFPFSFTFVKIEFYAIYSRWFDFFIEKSLFLLTWWIICSTLKHERMTMSSHVRPPTAYVSYI